MKKVFLAVLLIGLFLLPTHTFAETGWKEEDGEKYYYINDTMVTGQKTIDGKNYYFNEKGQLTTGFITLNNKLYFYSRTYGYALNGWVKSVAEGTWYQNPDGSLLTGKQTLDGEKYYFGEDGKLKTGFIEEDGKIYFYSRTYGHTLKGWVKSVAEGTWYQNPDGSLLTGKQTLDGEKYYFGEDGKLITGFVEEDGKIYFYSRTYGHTLKGWVKSVAEGTWYQNEDGSLITGKQVMDGEKYYFGDDGKLKTGFIEEDGKIYFYSRTYGHTLKGWVKSVAEGTWYQNPDGSLITGYQTISGKHYYFGEDGKLKTGFIRINNKPYFFSRTYDYSLKGWVKSATEGTWYQNEDGSLITGYQTIDGKHYYFGEDGKIKTGFIKINNKPYFFSRVYNYSLTGWVVSDTEGIWYQNEDGSLLTGQHTIDARDYKFNETTGLLDGFRTINGKTYYYNPDGTIAKGVQYIAGKMWQFNSITGVFEKRVHQIRVIDISSHNGNINWNTVKASGQVDAVILRLGYGIGYLDTKFIENKNELDRLGIPYSVYLFSYAENGNEALRESNFVVDTIKNNNVNIASSLLGIYYDLEDWEIRSTGENSYSISKDTYKTMITTFVSNTEQKLCIKTRVYASKNYIETRFHDSVKNYATWVAQWSSALTYTGPYEGWQYTSSGRVPGINGNVDMSYFYV